MTQRHECGGTYIGVSECTRREEYDGIGGGSKWGVSIYDGTGSPCLDLLHSLLKEMTVRHSTIPISSLWRVSPITLSSPTDMPSLTTVTLTKGWAFNYKKNTHTKSISPSSPSFLDITPALQQYLSFPLSSTHDSPSILSKRVIHTS